MNITINEHTKLNQSDDLNILREHFENLKQLIKEHNSLRKGKSTQSNEIDASFLNPEFNSLHPELFFSLKKIKNLNILKFIYKGEFGKVNTPFH